MGMIGKCAMRGQHLLVVTIFLGLFDASGAQAALTVYGYAPELHDRFYVGVDKDFIGDPHDWSGIARGYRASDGFHARWATMISDSYFLSANHAHPVVGDQLTFYQTNDPGGTTWTGTVVSGGGQIGSTDIWAGRVLGPGNTPAPSWVARYPLMSRPEGYNYYVAPEIDPELYMFGQGATSTATSMRTGRNRISGFFFDPGIGDWLTVAPYTSGATLGTDEAYLQGGDSGGPSFAITPMGPVVAGIHRGILPDVQQSLDSSISAHIGDIIGTVSENVDVFTDLQGDVNADFSVDFGDYLAIQTNYNTGPGMKYSDGDINLDGYVDFGDYLIFQSNNGSSLASPVDFNADWDVNQVDFNIIADNWLDSVAAGTLGDGSGDGVVNMDDVVILQSNWRYGTNVYVGSLTDVFGDLNGDDLVNSFDLQVITNNWHTSVPPNTLGDLSGDGFVDYGDYLVYQSNQLLFAPSDFNQDTAVDLLDVQILADHWQTLASASEGDSNGDGFVDEEDFHELVDWWGVNWTLEGDAYVPEPSSWVLALLAAAVWRKRLSKYGGGR
jgi:hypothetical protein